ncbi:MAG: hydrogenase [Ignavibacteriales bacterium]|nr:MAG: hydrogenase [Ignavibacteriales bacterium]
MIVKRNFNPLKVVQYVRTELLLSVASSALVYWLFSSGILTAALPFSVAAILGSALAIFIAFRNNSSYARWWEARTHWSGISNACQVFGRLIITFADSHSHQQNYDKARSENFKKELIYTLIAWAHLLRVRLLGHGSTSEVKHLLTESDFQKTEAAQNKPSFLHLLLGQKIYQAMANGTLGGFDSFQLEGQLLALANAQGNCERIKSTPLLRQYHYFTRVFLYVFILVLPFALIGDFSKMNIAALMAPVSVIIAFVFSIIGKVGEVNEDPFENRITDVPLLYICTNIERDLREMLGETNLPPAITPAEGILR